MPDELPILSLVGSGFSELSNGAGSVSKALEKADAQVETRQDAIRVINYMCDALQKAESIVTRALTESVMEYNKLRDGNRQTLVDYFERTAHKFSEDALGQKLLEGEVCADLHGLYDAFSQPFSAVSRSGLSVTDAVRTVFTRSSSMSMALSGLQDGERIYIRETTAFLNDVVDKARDATGLSTEDETRAKGDQLARKMRRKVKALRAQTSAVRETADECIETLH
jgi:hypothetical protein